MRSYTFSEARQNFATLLDQAQRDGAVRIQRRDGTSCVLVPEQPTISPLDVAGIIPEQRVSRDDILTSIDDGRQRYA